MVRYCSNCGNELIENSDVCLSCGKILNDNKVEASNSNPGKTLGIISLFVWIVPIAGWIVGGIGLSKSSESTSKTMNIIGIILATIMFVINLIIIFS